MILKQGGKLVLRLMYWLQRKKRVKEKGCGQCCLICPYYNECISDGCWDSKIIKHKFIQDTGDF